MNQRLVLRALVAIFSVVIVESALCTLKFNVQRPGVFATTDFNWGRVILEPTNGTVSFDSNKTVDAYCSSGFRNYATFATKLEPQLRFSCSGTLMKYQIPGYSLQYTAKNDGSLICDTQSQFYTQTVPYCKSTGLIYGFNIGNVSISFAEECYDMKKHRADFVHYVVGVRNSFVEDQFYFNPINNSNPLASNKIFKMNDTVFMKETQALPRALNTTGGNYAKIMSYRFENLVPVQRQAAGMKPYTSSLQNMTAIPWWSNLYDFNWQQVQNRISSLSPFGGYEVYAGTSHNLTVPFELFNETISYKVDQYTFTVPLYIWNLVKNRNDKKDTGVVIIGVNSPFFAGETTKSVLCKDTCDKISWMSPLKNYRKIASLGYVFCCSPIDVKKILNGFPQI